MEKFNYTNKTSRLTVRIPPELHKTLREYCQSFAISQSETIKRAIEAYLEENFTIENYLEESHKSEND